MQLSVIIMHCPLNSYMSDNLEGAREILKAAIRELDTSPTAHSTLCKVTAEFTLIDLLNAYMHV